MRDELVAPRCIVSARQLALKIEWQVAHSSCINVILSLSTARGYTGNHLSTAEDPMYPLQRKNHKISNKSTVVSRIAVEFADRWQSDLTH